MSEFIDIDKESGELIMSHMETALGFKSWNLLGAKYDHRFKCVRVLFSHEEDTDVHLFFLKMDGGGKLIAYNKLSFSPEIFIRYFDYQKNGFVLTTHEERLKRVFARVMSPELALKLIEAGVQFERSGRGAITEN
jgi:hypothetical protein